MRARVASLLSFVGLALACPGQPGPEPPPSASPLAIAELPPERDRAAIPVLGRELGLPEPPRFASVELPALREDGSWSILGLRSALEDMLAEGGADRVVLVRAYVQEVYAPPECPVGELCPPAKQPHAWLVDAPELRGKQRALMLIGYDVPIPEWDTQTQREWASEAKIELEPGRQYLFMGWFRRFSASGFAHDRGLLELLAVREDPQNDASRWIYPRNSHVHPRVRAAEGLGPLAPELARVPVGIVAGAPLAGPELVEPKDREQALELGREASWFDPQLADYYFRWIIVNDPAQALGWDRLASLYVDHGESTTGFEVLEQALARAPDDYALHNARGRLLLNIGEPARAVEAYRRAIELAPDAADLWFGLGMAYAEIPERERAIEALTRFLELGAEAPGHVIKAAQDTIMRMEYP